MPRGRPAGWTKANPIPYPKWKAESKVLTEPVQKVEKQRGRPIGWRKARPIPYNKWKGEEPAVMVAEVAEPIVEAIPGVPSVPAAPTPIERIYQSLSTKPLLCLRFFCPNHHKLETPKFHTEIMKAACEHKYLSIAAPREHAKSTIINFDYVLHRILYKKKRFILIVSNPFKKGAAYLEAIKKELSENEKLKNSFPPIKITKDAEGDSVFTHADGFETKVMCKGVEQIGTVRGIKFKYSRPDLIIMDDIEDDEMVKNPERRAELQANVDEALIPAGERGVCQYIIIGTILHDDSQLAKMVGKDKYPEYHKMFYRALKEDNTALWPEKMTAEDLIKLQKEKPSVFAKEYQNDPVSGSNVRFDKKDFRYWRQESDRYILFGEQNEVLSTGLLRECRAAIACDLAWKEKRSSDSTAIMPGFLTPSNDILIETYINKIGMRPDEFIEQIFLMVNRLRIVTGSDVPVGFEKAMLEQVTKYLLKQDMKKRNDYITTKELLWDADKETRIEIRLQPRYAQHVIYHRQGMGELENQLVRFPSAVHDDLCDAAQSLVQLLQYPKGARSKVGEDSMFDQVRQFAIDAKKPKKAFHGFGNRNAMAYRRIPAKKTFF